MKIDERWSEAVVDAVELLSPTVRGLPPGSKVVVQGTAALKALLGSTAR